MDALQQHLDSSKLSDIIPGQARRGVLSLEHNQSIGDALQALARRKVLSAPLVIYPDLEDFEAEKIAGSRVATNPTLVGWVDISDVLRGLISHLKDKHHGRLPHSMLLLMTELEAEGKAFCRKPLMTLSGGEDRSLMYSADAGSHGASLYKAIREQYLGSGNDRVIHRLAIFDAHGKITHIVSQLDIMRHLCARSKQLLGPLGHTTIQDLGLADDGGGAPMVTVDPNMLTLLAFEHMLSKGVSGAPVVTAAGDMVANLSVSDLKCIQPEHMGMLALPVAEFVALHHGTSYLGYSSGGVSCRKSGEPHSPKRAREEQQPFFAGSPRPSTTDAAVMARALPPSPRHQTISEIISHDNVRLYTVRPTSTLNQVLHILGDNRIHRVYVTDPSAPAGTHQLKGCLTPTDILRWALGMTASSSGRLETSTPCAPAMDNVGAVKVA